MESRGKPLARPPRVSSAASDRLRIRASTDLVEITGITLEAAVPGFADAGVVYAAEGMFRGSAPATARAVRQDASGQIMVRRVGTRFAWGGPDPDAFPSGEAIAFASGSPCARCVSDGKPVAFTEPDRQMLDRVGPGRRSVLSRYASFLAVPLEAGGSAAGLIALAREPVRPAFGEGDIDGITRLASCAGASIANILALERHRGVSEALQRGLLAAEPAQPDTIEVAGRCVPADGHMVGGDWYDIISLPGDRTGIVVGDVMGHGAEAATVMAQLRAAARVLARLGLEPAEVLSNLNEFIPTLRPAPLATCVYAAIDPAGPSCTLAAAGHLPPVLAIPDSVVRVLDLPSELSLGIGASDYGQARIRLRPGAVIAFYTDGLVETRSRSFDQGITVLRTELAKAEGSLEKIRDALIRTLAHHPEDDVTLILARIPR